jgi:insulysin
MKKNLPLFIIILMTSIATVFSTTVIEDQNFVNILTPSLAERQTLKLRLDNGLEAIIISDPNTDKSGVLLSVRVGSWDDPEEHPGIAHFLEHLLFLGTKKYPEEGDYHRYIRDHGGQTNAFTANHITSYMFAVDNANFDGALNRFSEFFKEPLFNESGVTRELKAIDQEFLKNLENDDWRESFVHKNLAKDTHPYYRFNAGNSQTLGNTSRDDVKSWYKEHYSANLMRLMVISDQPLETLKELVIQDFSGVANNKRTAKVVKERYTDKEMLTSMVTLQPVKELRQLTIAWELPEKFVDMKLTRPDSIICHVLGHEGSESLLEQLKREGLADALACGGMNVGANHRDVYLQIGLTDKGFHKVNTVVERVFQAINNFRNKQLPSYLFKEIQKIETLKYQYQPRQDVFMSLMNHGFTIHDEDISTYPIHTTIVQRYDPKSVEDLLNYLTPYHAIYYLKAPKGTTDVTYDREEPWFKVLYSVQDIDEKQLDQWNDSLTHENIDIPASNPFIPDELAIAQGITSGSEKKLVPQPEIVCDDSRGLFYYVFDNQFHEPKISWSIEIKTPEVVVGDASKVVFADLYVKTLQESLKKYSYPADVAGLKYSISRSDNGIAIKIAGFNDKAIQLLGKILEAMREKSVDMTNYKTHKETLLREYVNFSKESPLQQDSELLKKTIYRYYTTEKEKAAAIKKISQKRYKEYVSNLFNETYIEALLYGNMSRNDALVAQEMLKESFYAREYDRDMRLEQEVIDFTDEYGPLYLLTKTPMQGNAVILAIEYLPYSLKARAAQEILMKGMSEPFFSQLRTKQQTGYIVLNDGQDVERHLFNLFAVQSSTHDTRDLLARFELFIEGFLQELKNEQLTVDRFNQIKTANIRKLETPAKSIGEMGKLLQTLAFDFNGDFKWIDKRLQATKDLTYEEFIEISKEMLGRSNKRRVAFMMKGEQEEKDVFNYVKARSTNEIKRLGSFSPSHITEHVVDE